jgi:hypothetical protein
MGFALAVNKTVQYELLHCGACDIDFGVPAEFKKDRLEDGATWYCPRGHPRVFRESDLDRTRKLLEEANRKNSVLATDLTKARTEAAKVTKEKARLMKRVQRGVCPCCNRSFPNLQRHMATKHPEVPVTK